MNITKAVPPEHSFVDGCENRFICLDIDVMVDDGDRFFTTFRYTARVNFEFSHGNWIVNCEDLEERLLERYPSLRNRVDVRICLNAAKVVKQKIKQHEKDRKFHRSSSEFEKRCICIKG